ncbi:class I SAM-dependent methyltransferase [Inquilinus sp. Marseille-Q2685]|uniref:class I SAM-dependent methyltransferase n=1 Tax=Inquilinus sp. Marseille-Q2685 TaxID=2866581 RepID=UPI001CE420ED|nr:hypothetical protein [Inquilinus sp. Marseille-Q2685]
MTNEIKPLADADRPEALAQRVYRRHTGALAGLGLADTFDYIWRNNVWGAEESRSGLGSGLDGTARLRQAIPALLRELGATSLLDLPCGDFGWMSRTDLDGISYTGGDIVADLVAKNIVRYGETGRRRFLRLDLTRDLLPKADVVLCRDCLVHLSAESIAAAFANLRRSGSTWLLTTTFLELQGNRAIADGDWRPLNLQRPPFGLPAPHRVIVEGCTEEGGAYRDKALGLWRIAELPVPGSA